MDNYDEQIVKPGDRASKIAYDVCKGSWENSWAVRVVTNSDHFRGGRGYAWSSGVLAAMQTGTVLPTTQSDGAGGKTQFFSLLGTSTAFQNLYWEIIAMTADDIACAGGLPVMLTSSNLDVKAVTDENIHLVEALHRGTAEALKESHLALLTGETAIMPNQITAFFGGNSARHLVLTMNATCLGLMPGPKVRCSAPIKPGMAVVAFLEKGYRCNGGTKLTSLMGHRWGNNAGVICNLPEATKFLELATIPSQSYAQTIARLNGWRLDGRLDKPLARIYGLAHITGGGVWGKFGEILPQGVGADLHSMPEPPEILTWAQELSQGTPDEMSDSDCYGTFNGGCGAMVVCHDDDVGMVIAEAGKDGHKAQYVGVTDFSLSGRVKIRSKFGNGGLLSSNDRA